MTTLIDYFDSIIGTTYGNNPIPWTICSMFVIWLIYQMFTLLYSILGIHKS